MVQPDFRHQVIEAQNTVQNTSVQAYQYDDVFQSTWLGYDNRNISVGLFICWIMIGYFLTHYQAYDAGPSSVMKQSVTRRNEVDYTAQLMQRFNEAYSNRRQRRQRERRMVNSGVNNIEDTSGLHWNVESQQRAQERQREQEEWYHHQHLQQVAQHKAEHVAAVY